MKKLFLFRLLVANSLITCIMISGMTAAKAQSHQADEQAIREIIRQHETDRSLLPHTKDNVFVSGAFEKPIIGGKMSAGDQQARAKLKTERINPSHKTRIERLVVSEAGDMAYEFGYGDLQWDTPEGKHVAFESSYVRVWRKENGEWKVDVAMMRPDIKDKVDISALMK